MARQPLPLGTWGKINRTTTLAGGAKAYARFRDYDGVTRQVEQVGKTGAAAERALVEVLRDRARLPIENMTPETRLNKVADAWLLEFAELDRADGTRVVYGRALAHVRKGLGEIQLREATVPAVDRFLKAVSKSSGPSMGQLCRVVLQGVLGVAVRQGAISTNPVRDAAPITTPKRKVQGMSIEDVVTLRGRLATWDAGLTKGNHPRVTDLADVVDMILATGVRSGEVLALDWNADVDLTADPCMVFVRGTVTWVKGGGLIVQPHPKSESSERGLLLPQFAVDMLMRRRVDSQSAMVFPSSLGTLRSPNNFRRQWRDFRDANGYESWVTPKTFRKAVATLVKKEAGLSAAAEQLGHAGTAVTSKHYIEQTHVGPDVRDILQRFAS
ncbi:site-specific integrase [Cryobacterium zongtaii]|uniref:Site-specific integrase n=1 Tax=Cryobacterium zongtaii TaxID=1259217 RepID=A0A2S3Z561_9MICO|nr:site-specific integrase [Cryobacterium zongtaii]POH58759.1 site-specific integrase [Cryobacterium zongtaii]